MKNNISAEEMFNKLGYKKTLTKEDKRCNKDYDFEWAFGYNDKNGFRIGFDMLDLEIFKYNKKMRFPCALSYKEIEAINQQFREYVMRFERK